jgi:LmbE family N-acetylglucosaminyl deacetylase
VLAVWAHPDDEAFTSAGLLAEHARRGARVVVVTATLGEHGTDDPRRWPPARLAARRREELRRSLTCLGAHELHLLGFEDGACESVDATGAIVDIMRQVRPDLTVTFGPDGLTGHPDHRAVSRWVTDAWRATNADGALWYTTVTPEFEERWAAVNEQIGLWYDDPRVLSTPQDELVSSVTLSAGALRMKVAALRAHHTQTARMVRLLGRRAFAQWWATESFREASLVGAPS